MRHDATDAIKRRSPTTANRTWEIVRRLIGRGIERDLLDPTASAVFTNFPRPAEEKKRDRVLTHGVRERSKVTFRIQDVRRTVASGLGELGIEEGLISRILNHSTSSTSGASVTAAVYNQYRYVEPMRHALQAWADRLDEILNAAPAEVIRMRTESRSRRAVAWSAARRRRG